MERVPNQRGRAGFMFGEVREFAACPLPDLFYFLKISDTRLSPSRLVLIEETQDSLGGVRARSVLVVWGWVKLIRINPTKKSANVKKEM